MKQARVVVRDRLPLGQLAPLRSERAEGGELRNRRAEAKRLCNVDQGLLAKSDAVAAGVQRRDFVHALEHLAPAAAHLVAGIDVALHVVPEHAVHDSDGDKHAQHQQAREDDRDNGAALPATVVAHGTAVLIGAPPQSAQICGASSNPAPRQIRKPFQICGASSKKPSGGEAIGSERITRSCA